MKTIKQRREKIGSQYSANGYGRGVNTKDIYLIDGKCFAYHPKYANQTFNPLNGEFKGYIPVNYSESFNSFHQRGVQEIHKQFKMTPQQKLDKLGDRLKKNHEKINGYIDTSNEFPNPYELQVKGLKYDALKKRNVELVEALDSIGDNAPEMGGDWAAMKAQAVILTPKNNEQ